MELELVRRSSPLSSSISALALFFSLLADYPDSKSEMVSSHDCLQGGHLWFLRLSGWGITSSCYCFWAVFSVAALVW